MKYIHEAIFTLLLLTLLTTVVCELFAKDSFRASIQTVCSLSVLLALITTLSPLFSLITELSAPNDNNNGITDSNSAFDELFVSETTEKIEQYSKELICSRFNVKNNDVTVSVTVDASDRSSITLKEVTVEFLTFPGYPSEVISNMLSDELMCRITVLLPPDDERNTN